MVKFFQRGPLKHACEHTKVTHFDGL